MTVLHDGRADIGYIRMPVDLTGLHTSALFSEPASRWVPATHRLAGKESVHLADLADEHLLQHPDSVPEWGSVAKEMRNTQRTAATTPARSVEEKLEHVAAGRGFSVLPESTASYYQRPDVAWMPITGIAPNEVRLAWVSSRRTPLIAEFVVLAEAAVRDARPTQQRDQVGAILVVILQRHPFRSDVGQAGLEPATNGLPNRRS